MATGRPLISQTLPEPQDLFLANDVDLAAFMTAAVSTLREQDTELYQLLGSEHHRQNHVLWLVASSYMSDPSILAAGAMAIGNVTTDGYPGRRYLPGCEYADRIETLAIERAKAIFHARHANVQPHSCTSANQAIIFRFLKPGDTFLGMDLKAGGHLTHDSRASVLGHCYHPAGYGVDHDGWIDYDAVRATAHQVRPRLIIAGASAYSRLVDYARFRRNRRRGRRLSAGRPRTSPDWLRPGSCRARSTRRTSRPRAPTSSCAAPRVA